MLKPVNRREFRPAPIAEREEPCRIFFSKIKLNMLNMLYASCLPFLGIYHDYRQAKITKR